MKARSTTPSVSDDSDKLEFMMVQSYTSSACIG